MCASSADSPRDGRKVMTDQGSQSEYLYWCTRARYLKTRSGHWLLRVEGPCSDVYTFSFAEASAELLQLW